MGAEGQRSGLTDGGSGERDVDGHLVTVKVGIESRADQGVNLDGTAVNEYRFKGLDAEPVQGGRPVQPDRPLLDNFLQYVIHFRLGSLHQPPGTFDIGGQALDYQLVHDKGLEQLQGHPPGQAALVEFEFRSDHDNGAPAVINPLAEQVLAEAPLFTTEHIGQRLQFVVTADGNSPSPPAIVNQGIDGFLQHALFIADDNFRGADFYQVAQPVVAVDDAPVQVVKVTGGEPAAVKLDHGAEVGW